MQQHVKYLVVEDDPAWSRAISAEVRQYFANVSHFKESLVREDSAYDGDQGWQRIADGRYDLATLDMNLGMGGRRSKISGLDLLGAIADGSNVFFVIIITGALQDHELERLYGKDAAAMIRFSANNEAVKMLSGERVRTIPKPIGVDADVGMASLVPHLRSALDQYCAVSRERNIFRPYPGDKSLWEVRYNGGPRVPIRGSDNFKLIRAALAEPHRDMSVIGVVQSIAQRSSGASLRVLALGQEPASADDGDEGVGLDWETMESDGISVRDHLPVNSVQSAFTLEDLIGGLLQARRDGRTVEAALGDYRGFSRASLRSMLPRLKEYASDSRRVAEAFGDYSLRELLELAALLGPALRNLPDEPAGVIAGGEKKFRVSTGTDTKETVLARTQWRRARAALGRQRLLVPFLEHIDAYVKRGDDAKGHICYAPPDGVEFAPFWLTD